MLTYILSKTFTNVDVMGFKIGWLTWEQHKLEDLGSVQMNKRIFKDQTSESGEVPFFKIGTFGKKPDSFISKKLFNEYKSKYPYPEVGDILISASGSIGRTVVYNGEDAYFQDSNIVWLEHDINKTFLEYYFSTSKWHKFMKLNGNSGARSDRFSIKDSEFVKMPIPSPKNEEQVKIGKLLSTVATYLALQQHKLDQLNTLKKGLLQKMFADKKHPQPELRFKGFSGDWEQHKLENMVHFFNGLTYKPNDIRKSGTFVIRSSNIQNGTIVSSDDVFVRNEIANSTNVKIGDIIVVVRNGSRKLIGKHAIVTVPMNNTVIGAFMTGIRTEHYNFINALLSTLKFKDELRKNMGATINQITGYMFSNMKFMFPNDQEMDRIGTFLRKLDNLITLQQKQIDKLNSLKKSLLQNMFI
jgi:type I restriction enzyme S subunit